jgi:hypothetical protein
MMICSKRFNLYLIGFLVAGLCAGCADKGAKRKVQLTRMDIHVEMPREATNLTEPVPIYREKPMLVNVEKEPFLREVFVASARVVDLPGGFGIQIQFNRQGTWLLEQYSTQNHGKRLAIHAEFGTESKESRWLAAPKLTKGITDGLLTFTPDATREEADEIVLGLNNVSREVQKRE